ncbi:Cupin domain protein [Paraburkholderia megapolitana]|uniref:Cupin domain protein n=2 Tax=Paraburkholderia megapolitana TaxID=420953 RepID=A0A1I3UAV5_9BURK|nr:Cupin domain protein [Paraburkholderia megapolitana]
MSAACTEMSRRVAWSRVASAALVLMPLVVTLQHAGSGAGSVEQWLSDICSASDQPMFSSAPALVQPGAASRPVTHVKVLSCEPLPDVPGKSVTTAVVDFPPLALSGPHRHPGSVTAFVLEGTVRSQMEGAAAIDYRSGATWFEAPRALHLLAENPDPVRPAKLLAVFVTDGGCGALVIPEVRS